MTEPTTTALTRRHDDPDLMTLGEILVRSRFFKDAGDHAQAVVRVLAGRELGIPPIAAMTGIHIVEGKPSIGAHLIAAAIKRSKKYDFRVLEKTDERCTIVFFEKLPDGKREEIGRELFSMEDAKKAGLAGRGPWKTHPKAMLFARTIGQGYRTHCPDAFELPVYAEGEIEDKSGRKPDLDASDADFEVTPPRGPSSPGGPPTSASSSGTSPKPVSPSASSRLPASSPTPPAGPAAPTEGSSTSTRPEPSSAPAATTSTSTSEASAKPTASGDSPVVILRKEVMALLDLKRPSWKERAENDASRATTREQLLEILDGVRHGLGLLGQPPLLPQTRALLSSQSSGASASPPSSSAPTGGPSTTPAPKASDGPAGTAGERAGGPPQKRDGRPAFSGQGGGGR